MTYRPRKVERKSDGIIQALNGGVLEVDRAVVEDGGDDFAEGAWRARIDVGLVVLETDPKKCLAFFTTNFVVVLCLYSTSTTVSDSVATQLIYE